MKIVMFHCYVPLRDMTEEYAEAEVNVQRSGEAGFQTLESLE